MDRYLLQNRTGQKVPRKTIYLIRHGQSEHNVQYLSHLGAHTNDSRYIDSPLSPTGVEQAQAIAQQVAALSPDLLVTSPMTRAMQTCLTACADLDTPIVVSPLCTERLAYAGDIGSPVDELEATFPQLDFSAVRPRHAWWWTPPELPDCSGTMSAELLARHAPGAGKDAEPESVVRARCDRFRIWLLERPESVIVVFAHGAFLTRLVADGTTRFRNCEIRKLVL